MQINKRNKLSLNRPKASPRSAGSDFSSILDESPWERFLDKVKPLVKVLAVLIVIGGAAYGGMLLFGGNGTKQASEMMSGSVKPQDNTSLKLAQCLEDVSKTNPSPETTDPEFYPKIVGSYDKQLACHNKYPNTDLAGKTRIEELRQGAVDSSEQTKRIGAGYSANQNTNTSQSGTSSYDSHKCDTYKNEYTRLKAISDQLYDSVQKSLNSAGPTQESLMDEWKAALDKQNKAYSSFQQCQANNYNN